LLFGFAFWFSELAHGSPERPLFKPNLSLSRITEKLRLLLEDIVLRIPGLRYIPNFLTNDEANELVAALAPIDWDNQGKFRQRGRIVRRRAVDFLHNYSRTAKKLSRGPDLPDQLRTLREKVADTLRLAPDAIQQMIAALYRPGAAIDWHTDNVHVFGETICSVSLLAPCRMHFRTEKGAPVLKILLEPCSLLVMQGVARWEYQHHIPALNTTRYSVTLRTLRTEE